MRTLEQLVIQNADKYKWCPMPDCGFLINGYAGIKDFRCPKCNQRYCLQCDHSVHEGMTCDEYRISKTVTVLDRQFIELVRATGMQQCPKCKIRVERNQGCDHMTCRFGCHFCYRCGDEMTS